MQESSAAPWAARVDHASCIDQAGVAYILGGSSCSVDGEGGVAADCVKFNDVWARQPDNAGEC